MELRGPALALLEIESIARGMVVADAVLKRAQVEIEISEPTTPGKYLLLFSGGIAEVEESMKAGVELAGSTLLDKLFLPQPAPGLVRALRGQFFEDWQESIGIVETQSAASALCSSDSALKRAEVQLRQLRLARGIGGKGYFVITGALHMIETALEAAAAAIDPQYLIAAERIQQPAPAFRRSHPI